MEDSGRDPQTGTSTLTVTIGDVNDNDHYSGHKEITMYSYGGSYFKYILILSKYYLIFLLFLLIQKAGKRVRLYLYIKMH